MSDVTIQIEARPSKDSEQSYPVPVTFQLIGDGNVRLDLREPERTLTFSAEAWARIVAALAL